MIVTSRRALGQPSIEVVTGTGAADNVPQGQAVRIWPGVLTGVAVYVITRLIDRVFFGAR